MTLETDIRQKLETKKILLMTHIVMGYPDFDTSWTMVEQMVDAGVDLMELQIPFSEPMADGPVILRANQGALDNGATVAKCFEFARRAAAEFSIPFLFMTYANVPFRFGFDRFAEKMAAMDLKGAIVPDLPPEEGQDYLDAMKKNSRSPIFIFSPETGDQRMAQIDSAASGFIYCMARKGVTGKTTQFSDDLAAYLARCRQATRLPLAVGFGVKDASDIEFLQGKADIAVVGSQTIRVVEEKGVQAAGEFIRSLAI